MVTLDAVCSAIYGMSPYHQWHRSLGLGFTCSGRSLPTHFRCCPEWKPYITSIYNVQTISNMPFKFGKNLTSFILWMYFLKKYSSLVFRNVLHAWNPDGAVLMRTKGRWSGPNSGRQFLKRHGKMGKKRTRGKDKQDTKSGPLTAFSIKILFQAPVPWGIGFVSIKNIIPWE